MSKRRAVWVFCGAAAAFVLIGGLLLGFVTSLPGYADLGKHVTLQYRFDRNRGDFDDWLAGIDRAGCAQAQGEEWADLSAPSRIGSYGVHQASCAPNGAVIIWDTAGSLFDDAGFAHLPAGPSPDLSTGWFERPEFHPLGGDWYSFVASW